MVLKIKDAVGSVGVFGDPLQAIFGFAEDSRTGTRSSANSPSTRTSDRSPGAGPGTTRSWAPGC